jgi:hypothetical protein
LPIKDRSTTKQCRAYFDRKYNTFEASQDSLAIAGIANSVHQVQDLEQATRSGFISIQDKQEEQDARNARQEAINSFQAIVPLTGQEKGVLFLRGCISLKNRSYRPLLRASTSPFKSTCLLIKLKEQPFGLYHHNGQR